MGDETIDLIRLEQAELIEELGPTPSTPFGLHVVRGDDPAAELGRHVERTVFLEAFGNTPEVLRAEYARYDPASVFLVVVDHRRKVPAGALRLIMPSMLGLKSLEDLKEDWGEDADMLTRQVAGVDATAGKIWDIATLGVEAGYRRAAARGLVSMAMWQAVGVLAYRCRVDLLVAIIDVRVLRLLHSKLTGVLEPFPGVEPQRYLDSASSVPVWCSPEGWRSRMAELDADLVSFLVDGVGLEPVMAQPVWDEAAALLDEVAAGVRSPAPERQRRVSPTFS